MLLSQSSGVYRHGDFVSNLSVAKKCDASKMCSLCCKSKNRRKVLTKTDAFVLDI